MRICLLTHAYTPSIGGVAISVKRIAGLLKKTGYFVLISTLSQKVLPGEEVITEEDGILVSRLGKYPISSDTKTVWFEHLCRLIDKHKINIIHSYYVSRAGFIGVMAGKHKGIRSIVSIRGNDLGKDIFSGKEFPLIEWTLKNSSAITSVSKDLAHMAAILVPMKKINIIHNSVDTELFKKESPDTDLLNKLSISKEEPLLGFIGEGKPKKGIYALLNAFCRVLESKKAHLFIIGNIRQDMMDLIKFFRGKNAALKEYLHILPPVLPEYIVKFYNLFDIFVMPSLRDGMPNAILEAMACELPVITTSTGGIEELVLQGTTGLMVEPGDIDNLTKALLQLINSPEKRMSMGKAGRKRVEELFHPLKELEENVKIYKSEK
ncbi:MAG TPA: glycosyltransferase family 4 protein [Candidatus Eremiobacteraeota bacterium]|nr:MAG: GDP-mannose-dependent alpha-(1-6)-phosphatidylinositol monomannoside mannosyltransferase [bacterium ADurb.Bin363]HPZ06521.1 glycosyltransferase family 4 protein [Candidatus Eremiobacteraeota bacterium]